MTFKFLPNRINRLLQQIKKMPRPDSKRYITRTLNEFWESQVDGAVG